MIKARVRKRDGRRVYEVRLRDPHGREYSRTFETKKAAQDFEADDRTNRRRGSWVDPRYADLAFEEVARRWLDANPAKRPSAQATDESCLRAHLLPALTARRIGSVTPPEVQGLVNGWSRSAAPRSVRRWYGNIARGFRVCRGLRLARPLTLPRHQATGRYGQTIETTHRGADWVHRRRSQGRLLPAVGRQLHRRRPG
jgi:hypothetical protein